MNDENAPAKAPYYDYRTYLVTAEQKAQEEYDKNVIALSGGALGISFAFLKDVIGPGAISFPYILMLSWIAWGLSVTAVIVSYFLSQLALRSQIKLLDDCTKAKDFSKLYECLPGGKFSRWTAFLNIAGGVLFFAGVILITIFIYHNLELVHAEPQKPTS